MSLTSLKKKICVTVFLDELFEVVDEPAKKFNVQRSIPVVASNRRESASKTSFSRKLSDPLEGKLKSWSENYFSRKEKIERKIKKSRGCKPKLPVSVKKELDKLESKLKEKAENENRSKLEINKTHDSFEDEWPKECSDEKVPDGGASDNFSEFYESDLEKERNDKSTQLSSDFPVFEIKKIVEVTKLMESREIIQKIESLDKAEMIKIEEVPRLNEEDILRHSLCSDEIKKSFEELFRRKDSVFEKSLMSVRNESALFGGSQKSLGCPSRPVLQETNDLQFVAGEQENILCYAVQVEMATFEKIARQEIRIPSCLIEDLKNSRRKGSVILDEERCDEGSKPQLDDEIRSCIENNDSDEKAQVDGDRNNDDYEIECDDGIIKIAQFDPDSNEIPILEKINKTEMGVINVLEFKHIANFAYEGFSPVPKPHEKEEIITEVKISVKNPPTGPKSDLEHDENSTVICTLTVEDLCDEDDVRIICQLDSLVPDA